MKNSLGRPPVVPIAKIPTHVTLRHTLYAIVKNLRCSTRTRLDSRYVVRYR